MRKVLGKPSRCFAIVAIMSLLGCGRAAPPSTADAKPKVQVIGVSLTRIDEPWRAQIRADLEAAAAKHPELQLVVEICDDNAVKQQTQIEQFCNSRVGLIIIRPVEAMALTEPVARAIDAGIPVIVLDRALVGDKYTCFVGADYRQIGVEVGKWLAGRLRGKGILVELKGPVDSMLDRSLHEGFRSQLRDPGYRFPFEGHIDPPKVDGAKLMSEAMAAVTKIDALFACNDATAMAAYQTAKAANRVEGVLFVGVGGISSQGASYVSEGILSASFILPTGGAEAINAAVKLLRGEKVPKSIVPPTRVITKY